MNKNYGLEEIAKAKLEPFELWENTSSNDFIIHIEHPEFTALCPRSGYPDSATIVIDMIPDSHLIELKSIKLYINSFRDERISHENAVNTIYNKIKEEVKPKKLRVIGDFMRRGGVKTVIIVGDNDSFEKHNVNIL